MTDSDKPLSHRPRTGTEKRKRTRVVGVRMTDEEYAKSEADADRKGLTVPSYARHMLITAPQTRSRQRPRADMAGLARTHGELSRVGGNINQIARALNMGERVDDAEVTAAMRELRSLLVRMRAAMGFES